MSSPTSASSAASVAADDDGLPLTGVEAAFAVATAIGDVADVADDDGDDCGCVDFGICGGACAVSAAKTTTDRHSARSYVARHSAGASVGGRGALHGARALGHLLRLGLLLRRQLRRLLLRLRRRPLSRRIASTAQARSPWPARPSAL